MTGRKRRRARPSIHPSAFHLRHSPVVFDEFTSVVDRNVARVVSAAMAKGIRVGPDRLPVRGRHLPLRRDRVARAGLGDRHGHGQLLAEVSSATADRA